MKNKILLIGTIEDGEPKGWWFDSGEAPAFQFSDDGVVKYAGYTVQELQQIIIDNDKAKQN